MRFVISVFLVGLASLSAGCFGLGDRCEQGVQELCACGEESGVRACEDDGRWGECSCGQAGDVGAACAGPEDCTSGLSCHLGLPGGMCTAVCMGDGDCPTGQCSLWVDDFTFCSDPCSSDANCRNGYRCDAMAGCTPVGGTGDGGTDGGVCTTAECTGGMARTCVGDVVSMSCSVVGGQCASFTDATGPYEWCDCGTLGEGTGTCTSGPDAVVCEAGQATYASCGPGWTCVNQPGGPWGLGCECDDASDGTCPDAACTADPDCVSCTPSCTGKNCGGNGCGGSCGDCGLGETCNAGTCECEPRCVANGGYRFCGVDGCGGTCGGCETDYVCSNPNDASTSSICACEDDPVDLSYGAGGFDWTSYSPAVYQIWIEVKHTYLSIERVDRVRLEEPARVDLITKARLGPSDCSDDVWTSRVEAYIFDDGTTIDCADGGEVTVSESAGYTVPEPPAGCSSGTCTCGSLVRVQ